jgi:UDP-2-acetamido-3-amino-2,3-dideoxy-glucuronate N-acetyltransferase
MKIALVGLGYWGKIILKNLRSMGYNNVVICEKQKVNFDELGSKYQVVKDYKKLKNIDKVFVLTPASTHYNICEHFLRKGVDVFCEKPLCLNVEKTQDLYSIAKKNNTKLFVDWIFTFNEQLQFIKNCIHTEQFGKLYSVTLNRLNFGPPRTDVNARVDLASHDLSILLWLFEDAGLKSANWLDYKNNDDSETDDSVIGVLKFSEFAAIINASWHYPTKNRDCVFAFEKGILEWDDTTKTVSFNGESMNVPPGRSPLETSILTFFNLNETKMKEQEQLTHKITGLLK